MTPAKEKLGPLALALTGALLLALSPSLAFSQEKAEEIKVEEKKVETKTGAAQVLQDLDKQVEQRRREVSREEERLAAAKAALEGVKRELAEEFSKLTAIKKEVDESIARRDKLIDERLDLIAKVYRSMKPKEASVALQDMDDEMALLILERLPAKGVAKIFDTMPKERVRELTRRLEEGRNK